MVKWALLQVTLLCPLQVVPSVNVATVLSAVASRYLPVVSSKEAQKPSPAVALQSETVRAVPGHLFRLWREKHPALDCVDAYHA